VTVPKSYTAESFELDRIATALEQLVRILADRAEPDAPRVRPPMVIREKGERHAA
jgi:hypothetical protein